MKRSVDASSDLVRSLAGHDLCRSRVCYICFSRVQWNKRARYLPETPELVQTINSLLSTPINLCDTAMPSSICGTCCRNLRGTVPDSFKAKLVDRVAKSPAGAAGRAFMCQHAKNTSTKFMQIEEDVDMTNVSVSSDNVAVPVEQKQSVHVISCSEFAAAAAAVNLSARKAALFAAALAASTSGKTVVAPGVRKAILARNTQYQSFQSTKSLSSFPQSTAVWISKTEEFCESLVSNVSGFEPADVDIIRCSVDTGAQSLKLSVSFLSRQTLDKKHFSVLDSGVRKVFVFVHVTGVNETAAVVSEVLALFDTAALCRFCPSAQLVWAQDTKMNWIMSGLSMGGTHSCVSCVWRASDEFNDSLQRRTFGANSGYAADYISATTAASEACRKREVQRHYNVVRKPLLKCDSEVEIGDSLPPEPLHMKLRTINKLVKHLELVDQDTTTAYIKLLGLREERYHGEFEGRSCSKIAAGHAKLGLLVRAQCEEVIRQSTPLSRLGQKRQRLSERHLDLQVCAAVAKHPVSNFVAAFAAFDGIMKYCYGSILDNTSSHWVQDFKDAIGKIGCTVSVSMHMLADHAPAYCRKHGRGLRWVSAESHESLHQESRSFAAQWKVPPTGTSSHAVFLHRMVGGMNAAHAFSPLK